VGRCGVVVGSLWGRCGVIVGRCGVVVGRCGVVVDPRFYVLYVRFVTNANRAHTKVLGPLY
jgi:hypothetical protein